MVSKIAGKVPGWVGRFLIPEIERVVEKEVDALRREMNARFEAVETRFEAVDSKLEAVNARLDSIEKRFDLVQDVAVLKAEVKEIREKTAMK